MIHHVAETIATVCQNYPGSEPGGGWTGIPAWVDITFLAIAAVAILNWSKLPARWRSWGPAVGGLLVFATGAMIVIGLLRVAFGH